MKEQIKELRIKTDGLAQLCKELKPIIDFKLIEIGHGENIVESVRGRISWNKQKVNSKEIEKAVDSLYLGKAWLGKVLGELGNENPYGSGYKTKEDIVPTQDVQDFKKLDDYYDMKFFFDFNHIEKVDWLRTEIEKLVVEVKNISVGETIRIIDINGGLTEQQKFSAFSREFAIARTNCYTHLCEARFWLGFELERVRNEQ